MDVKGYEMELLSHASVKIRDSLVIYIDPWEVDGEKADIIFVTHEHFDHFSIPDIRKLLKDDGIVVAPHECREKLEGIKSIFVSPGDTVSIKGVVFHAVPAYNINKFREPGKVFHPKEDGKVGYLIHLPEAVVYHAGDTDFIPEMEGLDEVFGKIDVAFLPVSGTYVMTADEAAEAAKAIQPEIAVPMHYGKIVGSREDAERFKEMWEGRAEILI